MELLSIGESNYIECVATGWIAGVRIRTGARYFSLVHSVKTGSGVHPASYKMASRIVLRG
jgi:hypothetical protein